MRTGWSAAGPLRVDTLPVCAREQMEKVGKLRVVKASACARAVERGRREQRGALRCEQQEEDHAATRKKRIREPRWSAVLVLKVIPVEEDVQRSLELGAWWF